MKKTNGKNNKVTIAGAIRDIFIASINKGQLPILGFILIILLIIYKIPDESIVDLVKELIKTLGIYGILSYIFNFMLVIGWYIHAKSVRIMHSKECDRIGREKSALQKEQLKTKGK